MTNSLLSLKPSLLNNETHSRHGVPRNSRAVLGITVFWTLSIVRYSNEQKVSVIGTVSVLSWGGGRHLVCWFRCKSSINHWTTYVIMSTLMYANEIRVCQRRNNSVLIILRILTEEALRICTIEIPLYAKENKINLIRLVTWDVIFIWMVILKFSLSRLLIPG
jgi:hypothetical protein